MWMAAIWRVGRRSFTSGLSQNGAGASRLTPLPPSSLSASFGMSNGFVAAKVSSCCQLDVESSVVATSSGAIHLPITPAPHQAASRLWPLTPSHPQRPDPMLHMIEHVFIEQSLVAAFAVVGAVMWVSLVLSRRLNCADDPHLPPRTALDRGRVGHVFRRGRPAPA